MTNDPTAAAAAATAAGTPTQGAGWEFLDSLGQDARQRPAPRLGDALAGLGGALVTGGFAAAAADSGRGGAVAVALVVLAAAVGIRLGVETQRELRAAAVGAGVVAIPVFAFAATTDNIGSSPLAPVLLTSALYLAAWVLPGFRGRTVMLGLGALLLVSGAASLGESSEDRCRAIIEDDSTSFEDVPDECFEDDLGTTDSFLPADVNRALGTHGAVYLIGGGLLLGLVWVLDRRGYRGTATGLAAAGLVATLTGGTVLAADMGDVGGPVLLAIVGVVVCLVGARGARRATTWWGATFATVGVVAAILIQMEPSSGGEIGAGLMIGGALLAAGPGVVRAIRQASNDASPPPPPSPSTMLPPPTPHSSSTER